ncbi:MAG TPA: ABC transporter ATP-binding protein [Rhizomicrobium sp.]|jgi:putative ABC transport system ATP-binding protein|nr:ABC transporter ATP-binding protein [Rhizomicrobium sp.]
MISFKHLAKVYRTDEVETTALRDINLDVGRGEFVAVMGPSGCGKSTFLNIVGMLDAPSGGEYWFDGQNVAGYPEPRLAELRKNAIGFVFQSFNLIDELNVQENVELALLYHADVPAAERRRRAGEALERMKIAHRARHMPSQLSGGQQQRVAIARAVVARPKLILADEPTGNLDTANGEEVMQLLTQLNDEGTTIVMVTHSHSHAQYAHRVVNLLDGAIVTESIRQVL